MKYLPILAFLTLLNVQFNQAFGQETFSIVAVDTVTGEVGSAGASCLDDDNIKGGVLIISEVFPGRGAINTQASWHPENQKNAGEQLLSGKSPQEVIKWLYDNDVTLSPESRQYGIADLDSTGTPRTAAFTGQFNMDYKNHILGRYYSIQGNILKGQEILDSMEARFLREGGDLASKLMAALQGANVPGADSRCLAEGVSSRSAFIRVARSGDDKDHLYLDLAVTKTPEGVEPIDELQKRYDSWLLSTPEKYQPAQRGKYLIHTAPGWVDISFNETVDLKNSRFELYNINGKRHLQTLLKGNVVHLVTEELSSGIYMFRLIEEGNCITFGKLFIP